MTRDHSDAHKVGTDEIDHPALDAEPAAATSGLEEPGAAAHDVAQATPAFSLEAGAPALIPETGEPLGVAAAFFFDTTPFAQKSLEIWQENLGALIGHMHNLAGVKSFEEAVALQTRFTTECMESFERQSRDFAALTQKLASVSVGPLCGLRPAA